MKSTRNITSQCRALKVLLVQRLKDLTQRNKDLKRGLVSIRGLRAQELHSWTVHCEHCFAQKQNPPSRAYFLGHFNNDPDRNFDGIRVAVLPRGEILATCRVFHRRVFIGGQSTMVGGIGEVCTAPAARGLGLAKQLLNDAIRYMQSQHMLHSVLHAADWVQPLYCEMGWHPVPMRWAVLQVAAKQQESVLELVLEEGVINQLADIQCSYAQNFEGSMVRSCQYWQHWVRAHIEDSNHERLFAILDGDSMLGVAVLQFRAHREAHWKVKDFAVSGAQFTQDGGLSVFYTLAGHALATSTMHTAESAPVRIPAAAAERFKGAGPLGAAESDGGWMYRQLGGAGGECIGEPHLIWPMDSF
jgi:GNAT superfamily N-acetyltransferase